MMLYYYMTCACIPANTSSRQSTNWKNSRSGGTCLKIKAFAFAIQVAYMYYSPTNLPELCYLRFDFIPLAGVFQKGAPICM